MTDIIVYLYAHGWGVVHGTDPKGLKEVFKYDRAGGNFLRDLDHKRIPDDLIGMELTDEKYLSVEIRDYRANHLDYGAMCEHASLMPTIRRVTLYPDAKGRLGELHLLKKLHKKGREYGWTERDWVRLDSGIMSKVQPPVCLDPSPQVFHVAGMAHYNLKKFSLFGYRVRRHKQFRRRRLDIEEKTGFNRDVEEPTQVSLMSFLSRHRKLMRNAMPSVPRSSKMKPGPAIVPTAPTIGEANRYMSSSERAAELGFFLPKQIDGSQNHPEISGTSKAGDVVEGKFDIDTDLWIVCVRSSRDEAFMPSKCSSFRSYRAAWAFCAELKRLGTAEGTFIS